MDLQGQAVDYNCIFIFFDYIININGNAHQNSPLYNKMAPICLLAPFIAAAQIDYGMTPQFLMPFYIYIDFSRCFMNSLVNFSLFSETHFSLNFGAVLILLAGVI